MTTILKNTVALLAQPGCQREYAWLGQHALNQATAQMGSLKQSRQQVDQLIGVAYFNLRLRDDRAAAACWINLAHSYVPALGHYATWLRSYYAYVCRALGTGSG